jgi:broad specificity phosphatase PhoE
MRRRTVLFGAAIAVVPRPSLADATLDGLRAGGLIMLMRHAQTVPGTGDPPGFRLDDCSTQRNLSEDGRAQARRVGDRLRAEQIPVDRVLTSAWCRCRETAELLDLGPVERLPPLDSFFEDRSQRERHRAGMLEFIAGWTGPGNALLVTHQVNITAFAGGSVASGELVIMTAGAQPATVGRLRL